MSMNIFELMRDKYVLPNKPRLFEAFSGIGCQRMAFERLGIPYKSIGFSEIDKYAIQSYNAIHGDTKNFGSICDIKGVDLPQIDVFTWSFPCTDLSKAGKQKGLTNTRSGLVYEVLRIMQECKLNGNLPKVLIMENVVDLVQVKFIREFQEIQLELEQLGFSNYTEVLNAKDYGVAQNRDRVFMVSILGDYYYEFPKKIKLEKRLKDYLETDVDEKYYLSDKQIEAFRTSSYGCMNRENDINGICQTIDTMQGGNREPKVSIIGNVNPSGNGMNGNVFSGDLSPTITTNKGEGIKFLEIPEATIKGYAKAYEGDGVYTNRPHQKRGVVQIGVVVGNEKYVNDRFDKFKELNGYEPEMLNPYNTQEITDVSPTLTTMCDRWQTSSTVAIKKGLRIRKLSPLEVWRLMGIDDEDFEKASKVCSNSQLYKQAGNGIVVDVFAAIIGKML